MNIISSLFRSAQQRRTYNDLLRLDDYLLRDIGITRSDLHLMMNGSPTPHAKGNRRNA
jgi:uncharacterized protein YjiS (DUF1127 family)